MFDLTSWTVKFDPGLWTETVKADLRKNVKALEGVEPGDVDAIYEAALGAFRDGFNLHNFSQAVVAMGISRKRAKEIGLNLSSKANALMWAERMEKVGIKYAIWKYANVPCGDPVQDFAHKAVNGKTFLVSKGMLVNGKWTLPGRENGCKCVSRALIPGVTRGYNADEY